MSQIPPKPIFTDVEWNVLAKNMCANGFTARKPKITDPEELLSVQELCEYRGFRLVEWDGSYDRPICLQGKEIVGLLAGECSDPRTVAAGNNIFQRARGLSSKHRLHTESNIHHCGRFPCIHMGVYHGTGTKEPMMIDNKKLKPLEKELGQDQDLAHLVDRASRVFKFWFPKLWLNYRCNLNSLMLKEPPIKPTFIKNAWTTCTFNFGPSVTTFKHRDTQNLPFGICAVRALGNFDHTQGGHLVLWDLKLVLEFPPNSLILLPSALVTHSNLPLGSKGERASFVQYTPGEIFRYTGNGNATDAELVYRKEEPPQDRRDARMEQVPEVFRVWSD